MAKNLFVSFKNHIFATKSYNMKKLVIILFCAIAFLSPLAIHGADGNKNDNQSISITLVTIKNKPSLRPKSPSHQQISCTYTEGCLFFNFRYPEGVCSLEVTDFESGDISSYTFDSEGESAVLIGELNNAHILITTAFGNIYEGYVQ